MASAAEPAESLRNDYQSSRDSGDHDSGIDGRERPQIARGGERCRLLPTSAHRPLPIRRILENRGNRRGRVSVRKDRNPQVERGKPATASYQLPIRASRVMFGRTTLWGRLPTVANLFPMSASRAQFLWG